MKDWIVKMRGKLRLDLMDLPIWILVAIGVVLSWALLFGVMIYTNFLQFVGEAILSARWPTDPDLSKGQAIFYTLIFLFYGTAATKGKNHWPTTLALLSILLYLFFRL